MIKKEKNKFVLYSKDGSKKLGTFDTEQEAKDREKEIIAAKNAALVEVSLDITKASVSDDGVMRWAATCSDTGIDKTEQATSLQLFTDWIERAATGKALPWLPPPRTPFLGLSHYPALDGAGEAGLTDKMYIDGNQFKAKGTFFNDTEHPLGKALFDAVRQERALIEKGEAITEPIRISAGWWDIAHSHGTFIFERKSLDDICPMCVNGAGNKVYLKGQLDHFAATRVPINPRTSLGLEEKAMTTRKQDANSIINDPELVEELDRQSAQIGKSETEELPPGMVVKSDEEPDTAKMEDEEMEYRPFGGAMSIAEAEQFMAAQEQVSQVYTEWSLFRTVMDNILEYSDAAEIKGKVSNLINEFSSRVEAIKASVEDVYFIQPIGGKNIMADKQEVKAEVKVIDLQAEIDKALADKDLNRQQKAEAIEAAYKQHAETVKAQLDAASPPNVGEEIQKAMMPVLEQLSLIASKLSTPQMSQAPVQKSFVPGGMPQGNQDHQLPVSSVTGKPSALRAMINRSVGM